MAVVTTNPTTREVLKLLGIGAIVTASVLMPGLPMAIKPVISLYKKKEKADQEKYWNRFNYSRLNQLLRRLYEQKTIDIFEENGASVVKLTEKGKTKLIKINLEEITIQRSPKWDGKWRLIIYDVKKDKRVLGEIFRRILKKLQFLKLQRSVYLTPFPCKDEIEFLRQYHNLGKEVLYIEVGKIENEGAYKGFFGI